MAIISKIEIVRLFEYTLSTKQSPEEFHKSIMGAGGTVNGKD